MEARCEKCKRAAPDPTSEEALKWGTIKLADDDFAVVCAGCLADRNDMDLLLERRRERISGRRSESIVFIGGKPKVFGACTVADLGILVQQERQRADEYRANAQWLNAVSDRKAD